MQQNHAHRIDETTFTRRRKTMVLNQLAARGIRDERVLTAMGKVPREVFVPERLAQHAYSDHALPIEEGQTISQPYIVALMIEALELSGDERVLEIGTGSGYGAAVLSRIASEVFSVERHRALAQQAGSRFERLGYENIQVLHGDGTLGWPDHAPYDAIVVTAGSPEIPPPLLAQLDIGGRMVLPRGSKKFIQTLILVEKVDENEYRRKKIGDVRFVPLVGEEGWSGK